VTKAGAGAQQIIMISSMLQTEQGRVFMQWFKTVCNVESSLELEEEQPKAVPICPFRLAKAAGIRAAYYKVVAANRAGTKLLADQLRGEAPIERAP
jgi:hypothetical protein